MATALATAAHHLGCLFGFSMSMSEARQSRVRLPMNMVMRCHVDPDLMWSARANESRGDGCTYAGKASGLYPPRLYAIAADSAVVVLFFDAFRPR